MLTWRNPVAEATASHKEVFPVPGVPVTRMLGLRAVPMTAVGGRRSRRIKSAVWE